jgi:hypothetical protein
MNSERVAACAPALGTKTVETAMWHTIGAMATMMRAIARRERSHAIERGSSRVWLFRCRPAERFLIDEHGREGKIEGGSAGPQPTKPASLSHMITPRQSTQLPLCR